MRKRLVALPVIVLALSACSHADEAQDRLGDACDSFAQADWSRAAERAREAADLDEDTAGDVADSMEELAKSALDENYGRLQKPALVAHLNKPQLEGAAGDCGLSEEKTALLYKKFSRDVAEKY